MQFAGELEWYQAGIRDLAGQRFQVSVPGIMLTASWHHTGVHTRVG